MANQTGYLSGYGHGVLTVLRGDNWSFIHIPKCGGSAVRAAMEGEEISEVLPMYPEHTVNHPFHYVSKEQFSGRNFCFVRHPVSWLRSYWAMRLSEGKRSPEKALDLLWHNNFDVWARRVCNTHPGYVGSLFNAYTQHANEVYRLEDGIDPVLSSIMGETVITNIVNKSILPKCNGVTNRRICNSEQSIIRQYGYAT